MIKEFAAESQLLDEIKEIQQTVRLIGSQEDAAQIAAAIQAVEERLSTDVIKDHELQNCEYKRLNRAVEAFSNEIRKEVDSEGYQIVETARKHVEDLVGMKNVPQATCAMSQAVVQMIRHVGIVENASEQLFVDIQTSTEALLAATETDDLISKWIPNAISEQTEIVQEILKNCQVKNITDARSLLNIVERMHQEAAVKARKMEQDEREQILIADSISEGLLEMGLSTDRYDADGYKCVHARTATGSSIVLSVKDSKIDYNLENFRYSEDIPVHAQSAKDFLNYVGDIIYNQRQIDIGEIQYEIPDIDIKKTAIKLPRRSRNRKV